MMLWNILAILMLVRGILCTNYLRITERGINSVSDMPSPSVETDGNETNFDNVDISATQRQSHSANGNASRDIKTKTKSVNQSDVRRRILGIGPLIKLPPIPTIRPTVELETTTKQLPIPSITSQQDKKMTTTPEYEISTESGSGEDNIDSSGDTRLYQQEIKETFEIVSLNGIEPIYEIHVEILFLNPLTTQPPPVYHENNNSTSGITTEQNVFMGNRNQSGKVNITNEISPQPSEYRLCAYPAICDQSTCLRLNMSADPLTECENAGGQIVFGLFIVIMALAIIIGNSLLPIVVWYQKDMRTQHNIMKGNNTISITMWYGDKIPKYTINPLTYNC